MKKLLIHYFLFLFFLLAIFSSGIFDSIDGLEYLAVARNIYYKGEPTGPPYEFNTRENIYMPVTVGKNGKSYGFTGLGYSIALIPAVFLSDMVYKIYGISPAIHFPLENDWLILLTASFTNAFFGALLGAILLLYFIELGLNKKQAIFMSLISIFATNLWVYTKHSLAHMMFISFLFLSFLLVKQFFRIKKSLYLILAGVAFGISSIAYNQTFILSIIPLFLYFVFLAKFRFNLLTQPNLFLKQVKYLTTKLLIFFLGFLPFIIIYFWFESLRAVPTRDLANPLSVANAGINPILHLPVSVLYEGLYGQLLSPGRSIFLYSPILLLIVFFWHKIKRIILPELVIFLVLSAIYVFFYATQYSIGKADQGIATYWHGESSWGPRYLLPLIPFGLLIVGHIYTWLNKLQKLLVILPLIIIGVYIEMLGVLIPYQTKFYNLEDFHVNGTEYRPGLYSNLLPRYSPILQMTKNLIKSAQNFRNTYNHGIYNVKYYDGIELPFNVGPERWRSIVAVGSMGKGYVSFDNNNSKNPIKELTFGVINHPTSESSESAKLQFVLNNKPLLDSPAILTIRQRELIKIPIPEDILKSYSNNLVIQVDYETPMDIKFPTNNNYTVEYKQILGFQSFAINGQKQNLESIDVPYVSALGPKMIGMPYNTWGGINKDLWKIWELHTQIFERVPDLWWIRNLYHWDIPRNLILSLFAFNLVTLIFFGYKFIQSWGKISNEEH